ncbi:MAG: helix-turn-helix domain-containing protein [Kordiimonadaceae bacterium]|nr:helix-turn-helix domain-containing protein [Kordiimonadaceae bacterium]
MAKIAMTITEAVNASGISRSSLYILIGTKKLPSVKVAGRRLIRVDDLDVFLLSNREVSNDE